MTPAASLLLEGALVVHAHLDGSFRLAAGDTVPNGQSNADGHIAVAKGLISGCMTAALLEDVRFTRPRSPSLAGYVFTLLINYHTTKATALYFPQIAHRLEQRRRSRLASVVENKFKAERGHWRLARADLEELGVDEDALKFQPARARAITILLSQIAAEDDPVSVLGYAYVLERLALVVDQSFVVRAQSVIPAGKDAMRCLRAHSSLGEEPEHVSDLLAAMSECDSSCWRQIGHSAFSTMRAMAQPFDDEELLTATAILTGSL